MTESVLLHNLMISHIAFVNLTMEDKEQSTYSTNIKHRVQNTQVNIIANQVIVLFSTTDSYSTQ